MHTAAAWGQFPGDLSLQGCGKARNPSAECVSLASTQLRIARAVTHTPPPRVYKVQRREAAGTDAWRVRSSVLRRTREQRTSVIPDDEAAPVIPARARPLCRATEPGPSAKAPKARNIIPQVPAAGSRIIASLVRDDKDGALSSRPEHGIFRRATEPGPSAKAPKAR
jgi:hypothetical protein